MKKLILLSIAIIIFPYAESQVYMRTHKNIGVYGQLNTADFNKNGSYSFQTGITRQFGRYVLPELGYRQMVQKEIGSSLLH